MIESIKEKVWEILKQKGVSLAMIYNGEGTILWSRGRKISGKTVGGGDGFCKSVILESIKEKREIAKQDQHIMFSGNDISESAARLLIKHIVIQPVEDFFLYIDSGTTFMFSETEVEIFKILGHLLGEAIYQIKTGKKRIGGIAGQSPAMKKVKDLVLKYSLEEDCVLLLGETGVGKTHLAELIHDYSGRKGLFVAADTTTINENLFESEIFGHKKGAFTGAVADKKGLAQTAERGTLFFDEIAEVPVSFQAKLLRFIEKKSYRVLGDPMEKKADVRIIAATNKDLPDMIRNKEFREDLFYRLNVLTITIPPLRERKEDIEEIIREHKKFLKGKEFGPGFWETVLNYPWPGNYRELFSILKRAGILCDSPVTGTEIQKIIDEYIRIEEKIEEKTKIDSIWHDLESGISFWDTVKKPYLDRDLNRFEVKNIMSRALTKAGGKYVDTLPFLNIDRSDYNRLIKFLHKNRIS